MTEQRTDSGSVRLNSKAQQLPASTSSNKPIAPSALPAVAAYPTIATQSTSKSNNDYCKTGQLPLPSNSASTALSSSNSREISMKLSSSVSPSTVQPSSCNKRPSPNVIPEITSASKTPRLAISLPTINKDKAKPLAALPVKPSLDVKKVFNDDEEDEVEDIPLEARIRMRNKGRDNPTACGPNSFGKSRLGFCDYRSMQERALEEAAKELSKE